MTIEKMSSKDFNILLEEAKENIDKVNNEVKFIKKDMLKKITITKYENEYLNYCLQNLIYNNNNYSSYLMLNNNFDGLYTEYSNMIHPCFKSKPVNLFNLTSINSNSEYFRDELIVSINYIEKSLTQSEFDSIWEEYDGLKLDRDKNNWNKSYFASLQGDLRYNFSKERFEHILEVGRYVYGITKSVTQKAVNESKDKNTPDKAKVYSKESNNGVNLTLLLVGGSILLLGIPLVVKMLKK